MLITLGNALGTSSPWPTPVKVQVFGVLLVGIVESLHARDKNAEILKSFIYLVIAWCIVAGDDVEKSDCRAWPTLTGSTQVFDIIIISAKRQSSEC